MIERHTCGAQQYCTVSDVSANSNTYVLQFQPIKTIRGLQYQPIKTRVKETEKLDSYRRTTRGMYGIICSAGGVYRTTINEVGFCLELYHQARIGIWGNLYACWELAVFHETQGWGVNPLPED